MKIAQVSPIFERVPPVGYGGTERVISYLTEELVEQGHDVTLFASGDSITKARLIAPVPRSIRPQVGDQSWLAYFTIQMDMVRRMAHEFDVIHFHTDYYHCALAPSLGVPYITTMHGRLDLPELEPVFKNFNPCPLVSISESQRRPLPDADWQATVYHGLPSSLYSFQPNAGDYFLFVGRVSQEKRLDRAIEIAARCDRRLYIGAKVDKADEAYFNERIKPLLKTPRVEFIGEIGEREKRELLQNARALLFPIDWPEPFGLVMIESLCCGTPVIAYRNGSVPEIIEDGVNGFIVSDQEQAVWAAQDIDSLDRARCRASFENRFTARHMASSYVDVYRHVIENRTSSGRMAGNDKARGI